MAKVLREIKNDKGHVVQTQEEEVPSVQVTTTTVAPSKTDVDVEVKPASASATNVNVKDTVSPSSTVAAKKKASKIDDD